MKENILDLYSDYLIFQNQYATATGLSQLLGGAISHDKITRFLNGKEHTSKELWNYVKPQVKKHEEEDGVLIVDDTIEEKSYTDENGIVCWHYSSSKNRHVKGINIISAMIRYGDFSVPISFQPNP